MTLLAGLLDTIRGVRVDEPLWLAAMASLGFLLGLLAARWMTAMAPVRRRSALLARTILFALLGALLGGATSLRTSDQVATVVVLDVSGSVRRFYTPPASSTTIDPTRALADTVTRAVDRLSVGRRPDDLLGVVYADSRPQPVRAPSIAPIGDLPTPVAGDEGTDLESALRLAAAMVPPGAAGRILLISDGNQTVGDALAAAEELGGSARPSAGESGGGGGVGGAINSALAALPSINARRGRIPVDVLPLNYTVDRESFIESVDAPPVAPAGATVTVRVVIESSAPTTGLLRLARNNQPIDADPSAPGFARRVSVPAGRHIETIAVELLDGRTHRFDAIWEPDQTDAAGPPDRVSANNTGAAFTVTPGSGRTLLVRSAEPGTAGDSLIARALTQAGIQTQTLAPEALQPDLLWLQAFDLIVLENIPADAVPEPVQKSLVAFVSELGGGLVMVGGTSSFGAGGWKGTPIEPILPVVLDLPERLITPATAVVLIIDNSGSMNRPVLGSSRSQQDIANQGAALAIETLDKSDLVGVIVFNSRHEVLVPLAANRNAAASAEAVRGISADGGTNLPPALREALESLRRADAKVKHVIVLSDGVSMSKSQIPPIVAEMKAADISLTTISVGDAADTDLMSAMAREGNGAFYRVIDPNLLPRIFVKAVRVIRTPAVRDGDFVPLVLPSGSPVLEGLQPLPPLGGLTLTQPRQDPTVINALATSEGEPVLSSWSVGLGRVAAFTSDAERWGAQWQANQTSARFWPQLARAMARPASQRSHLLTTEIVSDRLRIRLDESDDQGRPVDGLTVPAAVYAPDGTRTTLQLAQVGPGQYEAAAPASASGAYVVALTPRDADRAMAPIVGGVAKPGGAEFRDLRSSPDLLTQIAERTGGRLLDFPKGDASPDALLTQSLFTREGVNPAPTRTALWRWLIIAAIAALLLDVATRRIAWDRLISREFGEGAKRDVIAATRDRSAQAARALERLRRDTPPPSEAVPAAAVRTLDERDAQAVIQSERQRRREARAAAAAAPIIEEPSPAPQPESAQSAPEEQGVSGLQAAKRRAQRRFDDGQ